MTNHYRGRTECVRPLSNELKRFATAFESKKNNKQELKELLIISLNEHYKRVKECQIGHGINRHMLGLRLAANELKIDIPLFETKE